MADTATRSRRYRAVPLLRGTMFDEMERLRGVKELQDLLAHYRDVSAGDRQAWPGRLATLAGVEPRDLVRLHGELMAYGWLEQNTGSAAACYRITAAGLRALKELTTEEVALA